MVGMPSVHSHSHRSPPCKAHNGPDHFGSVHCLPHKEWRRWLQWWAQTSPMRMQPVAQTRHIAFSFTRSTASSSGAPSPPSSSRPLCSKRIRAHSGPLSTMHAPFKCANASVIMRISCAYRRSFLACHRAVLARKEANATRLACGLARQRLDRARLATRARIRATGGRNGALTQPQKHKVIID